MEWQIWETPDSFLIRLHPIVNIIIAVQFFCLLMVWLKLYYSINGRLRLSLLRLFGVFGVLAGSNVLLYHPFYNLWVQAAAETVRAVVLLDFMVFMVREYGIGGRH
jgi:hypothetical protein